MTHLQEGDIVQATEEFDSNTKNKATIPEGTIGRVIEIDGDGDAQIKFVGIPAQWLWKKNFAKVTPGEATLDFLKEENTSLRNKNKQLAAENQQSKSELSRANQQILDNEEKQVQEEWEKEEEEKWHKTVNATRNMLCGVITAALLSLFFFAMLFKGLSYAPWELRGFLWFFLIGCWFLLILLLCFVCCSSCLRDQFIKVDDYDDEEEVFDYGAAQRRMTLAVLGIAMLAACFAMVQFQFCLAAYAFMYPSLTEAVPFVKLQTVLVASTPNVANTSLNMSNTSLNMLNPSLKMSNTSNTSTASSSCTSAFAPSTLNEDLHWNIERVAYNGKTLINTVFGNQDYYVMKPEWVAILAHCAPILAGLAYQFGIQEMGYASLASLVIDFVDVQDFYLLLVEDDIAAGYWSRPGSPSTANGAGANFGIQEVAGETYSTKAKLFEDDFQKQNVFLRWFFDRMLSFKNSRTHRNPYYSYWLWWRIMVQYIIASLYVCLLPFASYLLQAACWFDRKRCRVRIQLLETVFSLFLVEVPFLWLRFAASQYYGVIISSLCIKNCVSIVADIVKICLLVGQCKVKRSYDDDDACICLKSCGLQLIAFSNSIGENVLEDTEEASNIRGRVLCCDDDIYESDADSEPEKLPLV